MNTTKSGTTMWAHLERRYSERNGDDDILGSHHSDTIFGFRGDDVIFAGLGNDTVLGGRGDDLIDGEKGNDRLFGEKGNDALVGGEGNDDLFGGWGRDLLVGGAGRDELNGDGGNDKFLFRKGMGVDTIECLETGDPHRRPGFQHRLLSDADQLGPTGWPRRSDQFGQWRQARH